MSNFKLYKKPMLCTPMDVREHLDVFATQISDDDDDLKLKQDVLDAKIEGHIYKADAIVRSYLEPVYGASALAQEVPYFKGPISAKDSRTSVQLLGIIVAATAITEQWLIVFTTKNNYKVYGSFSGYQGTSAYTSDFTSTNLDIQIKKDDWVNADAEDIAQGEQFIVSTYIAHPVVSALSSMIAASTLIDAIYSQTESESSSWGKELFKKAMEILRDLADENKPAGLSAASAALDEGLREMVAVDYRVDETGSDVTPYETITDDELPY